MTESPILAWLACAAIGIAACGNTVVAVVVLVTGDLASTKLIAAGLGVMAATEFAAAHFLRCRIRTAFVPITCALTVVGECAFSIYLAATW